MLKYFEDIVILIQDLVGEHHSNEVMDLYYEYYNYNNHNITNVRREYLKIKYQSIINVLFGDS